MDRVAPLRTRDDDWRFTAAAFAYPLPPYATGPPVGGVAYGEEPVLGIAASAGAATLVVEPAPAPPMDADLTTCDGVTPPAASTPLPRNGSAVVNWHTDGHAADAAADPVRGGQWLGVEPPLQDAGRGSQPRIDIAI